MSLQPPLKLCFIPFYGGPSHTFSLIDIARYFAVQGQQIIVLATPSNGKLIKKLLNDETIPTDQQIVLRIIPMPFKEAGLPEDFDELNEPQDIPTALKLYRAKDLLSHNVQKFLESEHVDCIISDSMYPWSADVAANLNIPCVSFNPYGVFSLCVREALRNPDSPHHKIQSKEEPFVISGLPVPITMTKSELPPMQYLGFQEPLRTGELKCDMILTNSFQELETDNIEYFSKVTGSNIIAMGPACEIHRKISGGIERGHVTENKHECLSWLDSQKPNSVLYVNFGSMVKFPNEQLMEIACALESAGHNFLWVALRREEEGEEEAEGKWLPMGFHQKTRDRGFLQKSWAPQLSILNHPSVGGFITHCGWNSVLEGFTAGVPMITWPMTYEQFYNEKLVTQVAGIGVDVGGLEWEYYFNVGKKIIKREKIKEAIQKLMGGGDKTEEMRKKAQEYAKMAKAAVEDGGSTHRSFVDLIEEVKKLKMVKINKKTDANSEI